MPLIVVPTPIGNLEDITLRGLRELKEADIIACEDTRHTLQLLNSYGIRKTLISCHEHNEIDRTEVILARLSAGEKVVLVSDAGTPGLSDPGAVVTKAAIEKGFAVDVLPGANALLPALLLSGLLVTGAFMFIGFLKGSKAKKVARLKELKAIKDTLVFYVSPHRLLNDLALMGDILGDRKAVIVKEISKIHQERISGTLLSFCDTISAEKIRGEFVCVVAGNSDAIGCDKMDWKVEAVRMLDVGEPVKVIADTLSKRCKMSKNEVKRYIIAQNNDGP